MDVFQYTRGPHDSKVLVVAESWGTTEDRRKVPLVGESGKLLDQIFTEAGLDPADILYTNVVNERPPGNDMSRFFHDTKRARSDGRVPLRGLYPKENVLAGLEKLDALIAEVQPNIIIGLGNYALWALTDDCFKVTDQKGKKVPTGIGSWRGSQLKSRQGPSLVPTYHPAGALRNNAWRFQIRHDIRARVLTWPWVEPAYSFLIRPSFQEATATLQRLLSQADDGPLELAVDIETRSYMIACIGIAWDNKTAICIPLMRSEAEHNYSYWDPGEEATITFLIRDLLIHPNVRVDGQNFLYDAQYFYRWMFTRVRIDFDTMIGQHLCFPGTELNLNYLSSLYCHFHRYWKDEGKEWTKDMDEERLWSYNCQDCCRTFEAAQGIKATIKKLGLTEQWERQRRQLDEILTMMFRGVRIDKRAKDKVSFDLMDHAAQLAYKLDSMLPESIYPRPKKKSTWYTSPYQQKEIICDILGLKPYYNRSARRYTMDESALEHYAKTAPQLRTFFETMMEFRALTKFKTFTEMKLDDDGRMRSEFTPTAETFRWKSRGNVFGTGGNLQNIPTGDEAAGLPNIREQFIPDPGYTIVDADLSGADAQAVAWDAGDEDLKAAFRAGLKIHVKNFRDMWPDEAGDLSDGDIKGHKRYRVIKSGVHGTNYYGKAPGLALRLGLPLWEVEQFQSRWFELHPPIKTWQETMMAKLEGAICWNCNTPAHGGGRCDKCGAQLGRTIKNAFGYRRIYFDRIDESTLREALAWIGQSTVAINTTIGLIKLVDTFDYIQILLQVHDSLVFQIPSNREHELPLIQKTLNSIITPYEDPLQIPWGIKYSRKSWGACE